MPGKPLGKPLGKTFVRATSAASSVATPRTVQGNLNNSVEQPLDSASSAAQAQVEGVTEEQIRQIKQAKTDAERWSREQREHAESEARAASAQAETSAHAADGTDGVKVYVKPTASGSFTVVSDYMEETPEGMGEPGAASADGPRVPKHEDEEDSKVFDNTPPRAASVEDHSYQRDGRDDSSSKRYGQGRKRARNSGTEMPSYRSSHEGSQHHFLDIDGPSNSSSEEMMRVWEEEIRTSEDKLRKKEEEIKKLNFLWNWFTNWGTILNLEKELLTSQKDKAQAQIDAQVKINLLQRQKKLLIEENKNALDELIERLAEKGEVDKIELIQECKEKVLSENREVSLVNVFEVVVARSVQLGVEVKRLESNLQLAIQKIAKLGGALRKTQTSLRQANLQIHQLRTQNDGLLTILQQKKVLSPDEIDFLRQKAGGQGETAQGADAHVERTEIDNDDDVAQTRPADDPNSLELLSCTSGLGEIGEDEGFALVGNVEVAQRVIDEALRAEGQQRQRQG
jgi:hypothetical protein